MPTVKLRFEHIVQANCGGDEMISRERRQQFNREPLIGTCERDM